MAAEQADAFGHAEQTEALATSGLDLEAATEIANFEMEIAADQAGLTRMK